MTTTAPEPAPNPVPAEKIAIARSYGLVNVSALATASRRAGVPFAVACALMSKESGGHNVYGHDRGGVFSTSDGPVVIAGVTYHRYTDIEVTALNYALFQWKVAAGARSNGVGPAQITWPGFFPDMLEQRLKPWRVQDNMTYGLGLLALYKAKEGATWEDAGTAYNGSRDYGVDFHRLCRIWRTRLNETEAQA